MKRWLLLFCCIPVLSAVGQVNDDSVFIRKIADEILLNGQSYENLKILTQKVGARLAGSPASYKAEAWGMDALQKAGADKTWLQDCMVPHWVRGKKESAVFNYGRNQQLNLHVLALGNSIGTGGKKLKAPVIEIASFEDLEQKKDQVKGKIVFYNYRFNPTFIRTFHSYGDAVKYRGDGASRAAKHGAVGVIVRSMSHATDNYPHTGSLRYNDSFPKIPAMAVGLQHADKLSQLLKTSQGQVEMISYARNLPDTIGHNVIGELTGTEFPNEYITVGGHLDSWDTGEGAHDDGAGCVQSIEVLNVLKKLGYKPRRTIRVVLFANEENGLRGGTAYAEKAKQNNEKHYFALESDAGGFTPRGFGFSGSDEQLKKVQSWLPLFIPYQLSFISKGGGGADIGPLNRVFGTPLSGLEPDTQRYFDVHHADSDRFETVNKRELQLGAINMAALVYLVDKYGL